MRIELDSTKSPEAGASAYFEKAKAAEAKVRAIDAAMEKLRQRQTTQALAKTEKQKPIAPTFAAAKPAWHEAFHWILSSDGFLIVAGRDAKGNEELVKKHLQKEDLFLHADIVGAASTIIQSNHKDILQSTLIEAAQLAAACSRAWRSGQSQVDVYAVKPEQVSKSAPSGESMGTGAFMIYGERIWFRKTPLLWAVGVMEVSAGKVRLMGGTPSALERHCKAVVRLNPGIGQASDIAKQIKSRLEKRLGKLPFSMDDYVRRLPAGEMNLID